MPKKQQAIPLTGVDKETVLAICYQAFKDLGWDILFSGEDKLLGQTIKKWNANPQHILVWPEGNELIISSEMIKNELLDITGKNKKNINNFIAAFEAAKSSIQTETIESNQHAINNLRYATEIAAGQEQKESAEVDKAMNLSGSNLYVTYAIMAVNVVVFILMALNGAGIFEMNGYVHLNWGSNYAPLTLSGDWWRLITSVFIHFGIIHLAMNMYCLYTVGVYLEPMLGKIKYTTAYLCTGALAGIASLWWHKEGVNSAGASGAVFGLYGLFLALLTTKLIPQKVRKPLLQSILLFVAYNLIYGMKGGVDNAAHVGGLLSGALIGYLYAIGIKKEKQGEYVKWVLPAVLLISFGTVAGYLSSNKGPAENRTAVLNEIQSAGYPDSEEYNNRLAEISKIEDAAISPLSDTSLTDPELKRIIENQCFPQWAQAENKTRQMLTYKVSGNMHKKAEKLLDYISLRRKELGVFIKMIDTGEQENLIPELNKVREEIIRLVAEIQKL